MQTLIDFGYNYGDAIEVAVAVAGVAICAVALILTKTEV